MILLLVLSCLPTSNPPATAHPRTQVRKVAGALAFVDLKHNRVTVACKGRSEIIDVPSGSRIRINGERYTLKDMASINLIVEPQATITIISGVMCMTEVEIRTKPGRPWQGP